MNPLTLVKRIQKLNSREADLGISEDASWHAKYRDSAYVFVGGIPYDLTEGDLLAIFAQCGEVVDVNLVRDKASGKSKGFAFIAYEDQRSTNLAVDNLNAAQILGRTIRVDHVSKYKKKEEEDEETERQMREERGVCRAFQRGECTRGAGCKFSHDEQRAANTGWGHEEDRRSKWGHDKFQGGSKSEKKPVDIPSGREREPDASIRRKAGDLDAGRPRRRDDEIYHKADGVDAGRSGSRGDESYRKADELDAGRSRRRDVESHRKHIESDFKDRDGRERSRQLEVKEKGGHKEDRDTRGAYKSSTRSAVEDYERREEKRPRHQDTKEYRPRENRDERERGKDRDRQRDREREVRSRDRDDHHISQR